MPTEPEPGQPEPTFDILPLAPEVRRAVDELGYEHPTPVQRAMFEPMTRGLDLVVQARTGTGKTAAFALPLVNSLIRRGQTAVQALALCPTRELALQVTDEVLALAKYLDVRAVPVYGGAPMQRQIDLIEAGAQVVVGTPGRVLDHLRRGTIDASSVRVLVLDESDEMLSMGFLPQINDILAFLPPTRQTALLSATVPPEVRRMAETRLRQPEFITLSGDQIGALEVNHLFYPSAGDKLGDFLQMLEIEDPESAIVFSNTREQTKRVAAALVEKGYTADWINADLPQSDREKVMAATRRGELRFLVATDVASRGIDISHLTHVLNYDFPESAEQYVHRTGRTGRAGRTGTAISMVAPSDVGSVYMLRLTYGIRPLEKQLPSARDLKTRAEADIVASLARLSSSLPLSQDELSLARRVLTHEQAASIVAGLVRAHLGEQTAPGQEAARARRGMRPKPRADEDRTAAPRRARRRRDVEGQASPSRPKDTAPAEPDGQRFDASAPSDASRPAREAAPRETDRGEAGSQDAARRDAASAAPEAEEVRVASTGSSDSSETHEGSLESPRVRFAEAEIFASVGRRDGIRAADFSDVLRDAGIPADAVTYINVRQRHTFIGLKREVLPRALASLHGVTVAGHVVQAEEGRRSADAGASTTHP